MKKNRIWSMNKEQIIDKKIHLTCNCEGEIMQVNYYLEWYGQDTTPQYFQVWYFALFDYMGIRKPNFWHRIKTAWKYLREGRMHNDQIVLNEKEVDKLVEFIKQNNFAKCIKKPKTK